MAPSTGRNFPAKLTKQVVLCSLIAAFGGLMFGYDIGISGGVTSMDDFLLEFFPSVYEKKHRAKENNYCKYDNQLLQLFTSSLYLAAVVCSWAAAFCCKKFGRKRTMQMAAAFFLVGVVLNAASVNLYMLIAGRICLGAGIGFGNQAVPLFISEIASAQYRGGLNVCFQMLITIGILIANVVNYFTSNIHPYGWRISLGGAGFPAIFLGLGSLLIVETPTSLIERGKTEEGIKALKTTRGVEDVQKEYEEIVKATETAKKIKHPFRNLIMKQSSWPQLFCGTILQVFQQFTGINVIMFYAPVLFQTMGLGADASLLSAVVTGSINSVSTLVAVFGVDKFGRRKLLIQAAVQMLISQRVHDMITQTD
ncbi:Sugar transport protein 8 [Sesamum angolense]|uniref:Sugar transport protein 8 n=1 Tax=Sesamum angolense TaxID=2727404 RepID=A0AAE2C3G4_9LAMI|nr:Sugar transport protein 8 [Sesamum angolense]